MEGGWGSSPRGGDGPSRLTRRLTLREEGSSQWESVGGTAMATSEGADEREAGTDMQAFLQEQKVADACNNKLGSKKWSAPEACAAVSATIEAIQEQPRGRKEELAKLADELYPKHVQETVLEGQWITKDGFPPEESTLRRKNVWTRSMEWRREVLRSILPIFKSFTYEGEPTDGKTKGQVMEDVRQAYFASWSMKTSRYSGKNCPAMWCPVEWALFKRFGPWGPKAHPLFGIDAIDGDEVQDGDVGRLRKRRREQNKLMSGDKRPRTIELGDDTTALEGLAPRWRMKLDHTKKLIAATNQQNSIARCSFLLRALEAGLITDPEMKTAVTRHLTNVASDIMQEELGTPKHGNNRDRRDGRSGPSNGEGIPIDELMGS